jgi:hypothetical protein
MCSRTESRQNYVKSKQSEAELKVNRDRYNIDGPECKKRAYMYLELRTLNNMEI